MLYRFLILLPVFLSPSLSGQSTVFTENFDLPSAADSVSTYATGPFNPAPGSTTQQLSVSPMSSFHLFGTQTSSSVYLETQSFSTVGKPFVNLEFNHIAKLNNINAGTLQISTDGGSTWFFIDNKFYAGTDNRFSAISLFDQYSYSDLGSVGRWGPADLNATPDNSWWTKEKFILTGIASDTTTAGGFTGYPDVRIRFKATFGNQGSPFAAGWFIDDLKINAASCENNAPQLNFDFITIPCYNNNPEGAIPVLSFGSYPIGVQVHDTLPFDTGVDSVSCFFRKNGGSWNSQKMQLQNNSIYKTDIAGVMPGDQVDYYIEAWDFGCPNVARAPADSGFFSFSPGNYPAKCNSSLCKNLKIINSFPWEENFDGPEWQSGTGDGNNGTSHRGIFPLPPVGAWELFPNYTGTFGWSVRDTATGTPNTGPNADHTTGNGNFLYSEFSNIPFSPIQSGIITPCIDLTGNEARAFSFYYHQFGPDCYQLRIDIDTGTSATSYWLGYDKIDGPQQFNGSDPWKRAYISLEPFKNKLIRIRIAAISWYSGDLSDMAIDNLAITDAPALDVELSEIISPKISECSSSSNVPVKISVQNLGENPLVQIPVAYQLNQNAVVRDTLVSLLQLADTADFTFSAQLNFNPQDTNNLKIWTDLSGDADRENDTLSLTILPKKYTITHLPYFLDFESSSVQAGGTGMLNDSGWIMNFNNQGAEFRLVEGLLNNNLNGPLRAVGTSERALVIRQVGSMTNNRAEFRSQCIDLSGISNPKISFLHYLGTGLSFDVRAKTTDDQGWRLLKTVNGSAGFKSGLTQEVISLASLAGQSIQLSFEVNNWPTNGFSNKLLIDNILISSSSHNELGIHDVSSILRRLPAGQSSLPSFDLSVHKGAGTQNISSVMNMEFTPLCNSSLPVRSLSQAFTANFGNNNYNHIESFSNLSLSGPLAPERYLVKIWLTTAGDSLNFNDTLYRECLVQEVTTVPYFNDFEACNDQFHTNGDMLQWEKATPSGGAYSGNQAFVTNADSTLITDSNPEILLAPFFTGMDTLSGAELRFYHRYRFTGNINENYGTIQYLKNGNWQPLATATNQGTGMSLSAQHGFVFSGSQPNWTMFSIGLDQAKQPGINAIRLIAGAQENQACYWEVDDFEIYVPPQNSASPRSLTFVNGIPNLQSQVSLLVRNTGAQPLNTTQVKIFNDQGNLLLQENLQWSVGVLPGKSRLTPLSASLNLQGGSNNLTIVTERPNNRTDALSDDDTLSIKFEVLTDIDSLPYCLDFETEAGLLSFSSNQPDNFWEHTSPAKNTLNGAFSGSMAWITSSAGNYPPFADNYLYTRPAPLEAGKCYRLSFQHWYESERNFDGGNIEYSIDSGATWSVLGEFGDTAWYNTPYVQALDVIKPGFSGSSSAWTYAFHDFKVFGSKYVQFRLRFASGASVQDEGWMIDDLCLEEVSGNCEQINLEELSGQGQVFEIYPNPARNHLKLSWRLTENLKQVNALIFNAQGQRVFMDQIDLSKTGTRHFDLQKLPPGNYLLLLEGESIFHSERFVIH